jgi:DNA polymerase V
MSTSRPPVFALIDCNNFFVSCERVFRPDLWNKPVAVLSNNDGVIVARSNEVKALGIPMGTPYFKVRDVLAKHNVTLFSGNFPLYGDFSQRVVQILQDECPTLKSIPWTSRF